ncbi:hypothetical protein K503DRAFT_747224 [Rhizopogon vinicolor AM-OR11-026]|uniref:RING-type E3 ubiquitin transferase n=1 Tax=Rhizopogon vinicolor AM-OR11-026 TaxID=1314800 RepID=A0A1B7MPM3_9AGAM|nr:hypothetical protein K503DRAFT_747224 [Rhizopogon vinicolor AM-OR11-026]
MSSSASPTSSSKRIKLELSPPPRLTDDQNDENLDHDHCVICLQSLVDRTVIPTCSHEFCFECISLWAEQSQKCPLCSQLIGEYLIHHIRSQFDYQKHYLLPPRSKSPQLLPTGETRVSAARRARRARWGRRDRRDIDEADQLERAIAKRRWVYQNHLYAKHVASNSFTRYRPYPAPAQFAASPDMISRATIFLRRELRVWPNLDVEFLTTFTVSLMKSIDIRAESAVKLLAEFLDLDSLYIEGQRHQNAEHFAHEIYCYIRSGRDLSTYDNLVQYDTSADLPPYERERRNRWRHEPRSRSPSPHHRRLHPRSRSPSFTLPSDYGRSPSRVHRQDSSSDDLFSSPIQRRRTRSVVSDRRDISNNGHLDDIQRQSVNKSERARGKEPERDHTPPLRGENVYQSSSAPPCASGKIVLNGAVTPQQIAEFHTSGKTTHSHPPVQSNSRHTIVPTGPKAPIPAPVYADMNGAQPEPMASVSRKRPTRVGGRPPRTLLESVQAHLSRNTSARTTKHHTDAVETEDTPPYPPHPSRRHHDGGNNMHGLLVRFSSPPASMLPASHSHSHSLPPSLHTTTPLAGESTSANENQIPGRVRSFPADPIAKSHDEEMLIRNTVARPTTEEDKGRNKDERISASSPPSITPEVPAPRQEPNPNSNPISLPHNSNPNRVEEVAEHFLRGNQDVTTYTNKVAAPSARSRSSLDMRAVLLHRLEEEQRVASSSRSASTGVSAVVQPSANARDAEALETRLRTRALLRIRLAAIKTAAANPRLIES